MAPRKADGLIKDYLTLFQSDVRLNKVRWDMVARADFGVYAGKVNWKKVERTMPGGLSPKALALAAVDSWYLVDVTGEKGMRSGERPNAFYVVKSVKSATPQEVGTAFVRGFVIDVMESFVRDKIFTGYGVYLTQQAGSD